MFILHCDLWSPGEANDSPDGYVLACMCDLTQFVITVPAKSTLAVDLAINFFENVLMKVGLCGLVVVDAGSSFVAEFRGLCTILGLRFHPAARGNHQAVSVERFFRYLNKAVAIATNDRGTLACVLPSISVATYAWNACPIDGTDIPRSVPAIGREFKFPIDFQLLSTEETVQCLHSDPGTAVLDYISKTHPSVDEATHILQFVIEDRRTAHRLCMNGDKPLHQFSVGDIVLARVQVQSNAAKNRVGKLSYTTRGPFRITRVTGHNAYDMVPLNKPDAAPLRYISSQLSPLPAGLLPCQPVDAPDLWFLNQSDAPTLHPLEHPFKLEQYNAVWFSDNTSGKPPTKFDYSTLPDIIPTPAASPFPCILELNSDASPAKPVTRSELQPPPLTVAPPDAATLDPVNLTLAITPTPTQLKAALTNSKDRLFFVQYKPTGTFRPKWYLVQAEPTLDSTDPELGPLYRCHFYYRHSKDRDASDPHSRYWPSWHYYSINPTDGVQELSTYQLEVPPTRIPDPKRFLPWSDELPLCSNTCHLVGPFDFLEPSTPRGYRQFIPLPIWEQLLTVCQREGIVIPQLTAPDPSRPKPFATRAMRRTAQPRKRQRAASPSIAAPPTHKRPRPPNRLQAQRSASLLV
jgi:hypothetical protein